MWTGSPARSRISSACSVRSLATPVPTTPQPSMPTLIGSTCRSPPSTRTRAAAPGRGRPSPRRPRIDPRWPRTGRPTSCLTHPPPGTPFPPPSSLGAWPQPSLAPRCPSLATLVNTFTFSEADARVVTTQTAPLAPERALLDDVLPRYEAREVHEILVGAPQADVYRALEGLTLGEVSLFRVLMGVRALPARLARSRRRPAGSARPRMLDPDVRLLDWGLRGFTVLAQRPGSELVIAALANPGGWPAACPRGSGAWRNFGPSIGPASPSSPSASGWSGRPAARGSLPRPESTPPTRSPTAASARTGRSSASGAAPSAGTGCAPSSAGPSEHPPLPRLPRAEALLGQDVGDQVEERDRIEWLGHVRSHAELHPPLDIRLLRPSGQQHDRHVAGIDTRLEPPADLPAVHLGHHDVQQDQVRMEEVELGQRLYAVFGDLDGITFKLKVDLEQLLNDPIVVDDQDAGIGHEANRREAF